MYVILLPDFLGSYAQESNYPNLNSQTAADQAQPETEADQSRLDQTELAPASTAAAPQVQARSRGIAAMDCLFALGHVDAGYAGLCSWTGLSVARMLERGAMK